MCKVLKFCVQVQVQLIDIFLNLKELAENKYLDISNLNFLELIEHLKELEIIFIFIDLHWC